MPDLDKSKITIALAVTMMLAAVGGTASAVWYLARIDMRLSRLEEHIPRDWTLFDQTVWAGRLKEANPTLTVPQPLQAPIK